MTCKCGDRELALQKVEDNLNIAHAEKVLKVIDALVASDVLTAEQAGNTYSAIATELGWF
jgi:hypothetical protein